jgi:hypothetical protein
VGKVTPEEKFLGLPTTEGRMCKNHFKSTKERLAKRFSREVHVRGAKEVLIKSMMQTIPTYVMGVFKLPITLCDELMQMICYFWWGEESGQWKVHWLAWEKVLMPKCLCGLGFRDMRLFNQALLARQAWRLIQLPDSLCAQLLKSMYYPRRELVDTVFLGDASPTWRAIEHGLDLLKNGII